MKRDLQCPEEYPSRPEPPPAPRITPEPTGEAEDAELKCGSAPVWIFGYGSLVWRPGFEFTSRKVGFIRGYSRRFWQGDTFHRGSEKMVRAGAAVEPGGRRWAAGGAGSASNGSAFALPHSPGGW